MQSTYFQAATRDKAGGESFGRECGNYTFRL